MSGKVEAWKVEGVQLLPARQGTGGKKVPVAWLASMVSVADERVMVQAVLKAWPGPDAASVKVGAVVRAERRVWNPPEGGRPKVSYMVVSPKAARAVEAKEELEERLSAMERRIAHLEELMDKVWQMLHERTVEAERKAGGNPERYNPPVSKEEREAAERYCKELADPERKFQMMQWNPGRKA